MVRVSRLRDSSGKVILFCNSISRPYELFVSSHKAMAAAISHAIRRRRSPALCHPAPPPTIGQAKFYREDASMPLSGEAIRLMNYIDDVSVTLRRVLAFIPTLTPEERARVSNHLRASKPSLNDVTQALEAE